MTREEQMAMAGDYVLGLMEDAERAAFEGAMKTDPALTAAVSRLERQLQSLDDTAEGEADPALWAAIEARLDDLPQDDAATPAPANDNARPRRWMTWAAMAASVVVGLGVGYLAGTGNVPTDRPVMIAVLIDEADMRPGAIVEAFADDSIRIVPLEDFAVPEGRVLQVWTLPDAETGPVSLGTLDRASDARLAGPDLPAPADGQLYEITLEPAPGSPTGRPTGPILVKGFARPPV